MSEHQDLIEFRDEVRAVVRAGHEHDATRLALVERARKRGYGDVVPDNWRADGSLKDTANVWSSAEQRETANDVFTALQGALEDAYDGQYSSWSIWVQDWDGSDGGYRVIYCCASDLWAAPFEWTDGNKVVVDVSAAAKVRPITSYVERKATQRQEWRQKKAQLLRGLERREFSTADLEIREAEDGDSWKLTGYASVTETPYEVGFYTETIKRGAFKRTLGEAPDVQLLVNHEGLPLARTRSGTLTLEERDRGLWVDADLDKQDPDAQRLYRKMQRGDIDQMSFAFQVTDQDWNEDYTSRTIKSLSIHRGDVSVVNQGANATSTASIRSTEALLSLRRVGADGVIAALHEYRAGKTLSSATTEVLTRVLELVASADEAVDEAQPLLADLLGVPNPDEYESESDEGEDDVERAAELPAPLVIPDYTTRARERLAAIRRTC